MRRTTRLVVSVVIVIFLAASIPSAFAQTVPQISVGDASILEGNAGLTMLLLPVSFDIPLPANTCFLYQITQGSADDVDGESLPKIAQHCANAGAISTSLFHAINGDTEIEPDEFVAGQILSIDQSYDVVDDAGIGWILNDDGIAVGPTVHNDATCTGAFPDNQLAQGEYQLVQKGTNSGFGNVIGKDASLMWNTDGSGGLQFALQKGPGDLNDAVVIYIDSIDGGFDKTNAFTDEADPLRAAISGQSLSDSGSAPLAFGAGFTADFAIAFDSTYAGLWALQAGGSHIFVKGIGIQPASTTQALYEFGAALAPYDALNLLDIGVAQGGSFKFVATYINAGNAFRSNEFVGAAETTASGGNIGVNPFTLADGDFSTVVTYGIPDLTFATNGFTAYYEGQIAEITAKHVGPSGDPFATDCTAVYLYSFGGTATLGDDYTSAPENPDPLTIGPGQSQSVLTLPTIDDPDIEGDENFTIEPISFALGDLSPEILDRPLLDNEIVVSLGYGQGSSNVAEGDIFTFLVQLSQIAPYDINVTVVKVFSGSAEPEDMDAAPVSVLIPAGETFVEKTVGTTEDIVFESDETFELALSGTPGNPAGAVLDPAHLPVTILEDDLLPAFSISDVSLSEGATGETPQVTLTITLSGQSEWITYVDVAAQDDTAEVGDGDYGAFAAPIEFQPGVVEKDIVLSILGDDKYENDEKFLVILSPSSDPASGPYTISDTTGEVTILNDDALPTVSLSNQSVTEGTTVPATDGTINIEVTLDRPSENPVTVQIDTADDTATLDDSDYSGVAGLIVEFVPGDTSETFTLSINQDAKYEADETFTATLSSPSGASLGTASATYTILNDDSAPTLTIDGADVLEGDTGLSDPGHAVMQFSFVLSAESGLPVSFDWATTPGGASPATPDEDYVATGTGGSVTIPAGSLNGLVYVDILGETVYEDDETVGVLVSGLTGATIPGGSSAFASILNDDNVPTITLVPAGGAAEPVGVTEVDTGVNTTVTFETVLSNPTEQTVSFTIRSTDGTAVRPADYDNFFSDPETISPGVDLRSFSFIVRGDAIYETNETFTIDLVSVTNATPADIAIDYVIEDNDPIPTVSVVVADEPEGDTGGTNVEYEIVLSRPSAFLIQVNAETVDGTATLADADYLANSGVVEFSAGSVVVPFNIVVNGDTVFEPNETIGVQLSHVAIPSAVAIGTPNPAFGTILNDDMGGDLIDNGGFEGGGGRSSNLDPWVVGFATGTPADDKVRCSPGDGDAKPNNGACSFRFKGGLNESSSLKQTIQQQGGGLDDLIPGVDYGLGFAYRSGAAGVVKIQVKVTYASDVAGEQVVKFKKGVGGSTGGIFVLDTLTLSPMPANITKIQVRFKHTSLSGKLYIDDVTLLPVTARAVPPGVLPPPNTPDEWNRP